jgi:HlyD family secretion protein
MTKINTSKSMRRYVAAGYLSMLLMVGVGGAWSVLTTLNSAVIAPAVIVAESYSKKVQHKDGGIVREILVKDGDKVSAGQTVVVLDNTDAKAEVTILTSLLNEALAKRARLEAERDGATTITYPTELLEMQDNPGLKSVMLGQDKILSTRQQGLQGRTEQMNQQIGQLQEQISGLDSQRRSKEKQLAFIADELAGLRALAKKGLVPNTRISALEREQARLDGERGELTASRASAEAKIAEVKLQMIQVRDEYLNQALSELRDVEGRVAELSERRQASLAKIGRLEVKAPADGTIYQLSVHTLGGVVAPGETLMLLVPEGDDLVLQAQISPQDIDEVHSGQAANIRFPVFNSRITPELRGEVVQVGADVTRNDANSPAFYSVRLELPAAELQKLGDHKLRPGMPAEAFIQTTAQTPLSYFLKPLTDQFAHALRES